MPLRRAALCVGVRKETGASAKQREAPELSGVYLEVILERSVSKHISFRVIVEPRTRVRAVFSAGMFLQYNAGVR